MTRIDITCGACGKVIPLFIDTSRPAAVAINETAPGPELLGMSLASMELSVRTYNALGNAGIQTVGQLIGFTREELGRFKYLGKISLREIEWELNLLGLRLKGRGGPLDINRI